MLARTSCHEAAEVAPADVRLDDDAAHPVLAAHLGGRLDEVHLRELGERDPLAFRAGDEQPLDLVDVAAALLREAGP